LRLPGFLDNQLIKMVGFSAHAPAVFTPQEKRVTREFHNKDLDFHVDISNMRFSCKVLFYILLTVHLDVILVNDQLDALFLNVFISCL
jgi:hypothetical protein